MSAPGVDDPQPHPLTGAGPHREGVGPEGAVDQVVGVVHVPGVGAQRVRRIDRGPYVHPGHAAVVHAHAAHHRHPALAQFIELLVRGPAAHPVEPVVEDQDGLEVVVAALGRVFDDDRGVQAPPVELHPDMGGGASGCRRRGRGTRR